MKPELFAAIASAISASCARITVYFNRSQGKGFVWTKDHQIGLLTNEKGAVHIQVSIPPFNLGRGNIRFLELNGKKINLKTIAMENFSLDMDECDEAHFPERVPLITYTTAIDTDIRAKYDTKLVPISGRVPETIRNKEYQEELNRKIHEIPEHILILKCRYKDGRWFGIKERETVIGLSVKGLSISYLSTARRKELNEYFAW